MATENKDMQQRRGTAAGWTSANPTLKAGELGVETDTGRAKVGDGSTAWNSLDYVDIGALDALTVHEGDFDADHGADHDARDHSTAVGTASFGDLGDVDMATAAPTTGQFPEWDGAKWVPTDIDGGSA